MKLHVKIALANDRDEEFCGFGLLQLIDGIDRHGSIQQAAREMDLSYVKALKILNRLERELGETLLVRHKGGAARGSTELTPFAHQFVAEFAKLRQWLIAAGKRKFPDFVERIRDSGFRKQGKREK